MPSVPEDQNLSHARLRFVDNLITDGINFTGFDPLKTSFIVVGVVCRARKCRPNSAVLSKNHKLGSKYSEILWQKRVWVVFRTGTLAIEDPFLIKPS